MNTKSLGLTLTLAIAAILLGISTGIPSAAEAAPPACKGPNKDDPRCGGGGDNTDPALYIVDWVGGVALNRVAGNSGGDDGSPHDLLGDGQYWTAVNKIAGHGGCYDKVRVES